MNGFFGVLVFPPILFAMSWIVCECFSTSINRLKNKGTTWDSGINGIGTFYARMMQHLPVGIAGAISCIIVTWFALDSLRYVEMRTFPTTVFILFLGVIGFVLMIFGWRARLAREAYTEWRSLERTPDVYTTINGNVYRILRLYKAGNYDYDIVSPAERLQANQAYLIEAEQRLSNATRELIICFVIAGGLWLLAAFVLSKFQHNPFWNAAVPTGLGIFICAYQVGMWITCSWDLSAHRGTAKFITAPRPTREIVDPVDLDDISKAKPTGAADFASSGFAPQSPHQPPPQSPHQPSAKPASKYQNPFE